MAEAGDALSRPVVTLGSDCSGLELTPMILKELGYDCRSLWVSETSQAALKFIRCNAEPERIDRDILERDNTTLPQNPDIYIAGPPCTAWSSMNCKQKENDPRREVFENCLDTIAETRPKIFIIENTRSLLHYNKGKFWELVSRELDHMKAYHWDYSFLCPSAHADCPQSRPRIYIVGLRKDLGVRHIPWPQEIPLTKTCLSLLDMEATGRRKVAPCYWRMLDRWGISHDAPGIIEPNGASRSYSPYKMTKELTDAQRANIAREDKSACLVAHDPSPFCPKLKGHLTTNELFKLQGYDPEGINIPTSLTQLQMAGLVGNAFNGAVVRELLKRLVPLVVKK
jgi:site-specific DNA-cytosine methylase